MKNNWEVLDLSILRTPILSLNYYRENFSTSNNPEEIVNLILDNALIKEALSFTNPDFFRELENYNSKSEKKKRKLINTLLKYISRMTSKTAPLGLFSSISEVEYSDCEEIRNIAIGEEEESKNIFVDLSWFNKLIKKLEQDSNIISYTTLKVNDLYLIEGNRIYFPYRSLYGEFTHSVDNLKEYMFSVHFSELLSLIINQTKNGLECKQLINKIQTEYPELREADILTYIKNLIGLEILITDLRPNLREKNHLTNLIGFFESKNLNDHEIYIKIKKISNLITNYKSAEDNFTSFFERVKDEMIKLVPSKELLQVDLKKKNTLLPSSIKMDVEKSLDILKLFTVPIEGATNLKPFIDSFVDKYGYYQEVDLIELIYSGNLNMPQDYQFPPGNLGGDVSKNMNVDMINILSTLIQKSALSLDEEIVIDKRLIHKLNTNFKIEQTQLVESFDLLFSWSQKNNTHYLNLNNEVITKNGAQLIGRFLYSMTDDKKEEINKLRNFENKKYGEDYLLAEITCPGLLGRASNISTTTKMRDYVIPIMGSTDTEEKVINLSSITCYINSKGHVVLKDKNTGKKIKVKLTSMLHGLTYYPNIYRFLIEVEGQGKYHMSSIFPLIQDTLQPLYLPRIRYKNIVLQKRTWKLTSEILDIERGDTLDAKLNKFNEWKKKFLVPDYVELKERDSALIMCLKNDLYINLLLKEIEKNNEVFLLELDYGLEISDNMSTSIYKSDITFSILNLEHEVPKELVENTIMNNPPIYPPGKKYLYYKLYIRPDYQNLMLYRFIAPLMESLKNEGIVEGYFFIRYVDTNNHIRLRIEFDEDKKDALFVELSNYFNELVDSKFINKISIDTYFPETGRYGGEDLLPLIHSYFYKDSLSTIKLLYLIDQKNLTLEQVLYHTINNILESFDIKEKNDKIEFLEKYSNLYAISSESKKNTSENIIINNLIIDTKVENIISLPTLSLLNINTKIKSKKQREKEEIIFSLIHMHFNRMMEIIDRNKEIEFVNILLNDIKTRSNLNVTNI